MFEHFLAGSTLTEVYAAVGAVANRCAKLVLLLAVATAAAQVSHCRWLDLLDTQGMDVTDEELLSYISESSMMSKTMDEYEGAHVTSSTLSTSRSSSGGHTAAQDSSWQQQQQQQQTNIDWWICSGTQLVCMSCRPQELRPWDGQAPGPVPGDTRIKNLHAVQAAKAARSRRPSGWASSWGMRASRTRGSTAHT